jgi:hypothetical protein
MAVDTTEITAPDGATTEPATEAKPEKQEKQIFAGEYFADASGKVTVMLTFPLEALQGNFANPIGGILALANAAGVKGYGPDDTPQATVGVQRAKVKNSEGAMVDNPDAGKPSGAYSIVLHTEASLVEARKRGRAGTPEVVKKAGAAVSAMLKSVLEQPDGLALIESLVKRQESGELSLADVLAEIEAKKNAA